MKIIENDQFFNASTIQLAKKLLGCKLSHIYRGQKASGIIVETEAYCHADDPAAHSFRGRTRRNQAMFLGPGHLYVYLIYGVHHCVNVVSEKEGLGAAVLIRALEPVDGLQLMKKRRGNKSEGALCIGPGKLCQALAITRAQNGLFLPSANKLFLETETPRSAPKIAQSPRIGISKGTELPWRFFIKESPWVSR